MNRFVQVAHDGQGRWGDQSSYKQNQNPGAEIIDFPSDRQNRPSVASGLLAKVIDLTSYRASTSLTSLKHQ